PVAPVHWRGVRQANHLAPVCPQPIPSLPANQSTPTAPSSPFELNRNMSHRYLERLQRQISVLRNQYEDCPNLNICVPFEEYYQERLRQQRKQQPHKSSGKWDYCILGIRIQSKSSQLRMVSTQSSQNPHFAFFVSIQ